jgi:hypothetical protein
MVKREEHTMNQIRAVQLVCVLGCLALAIALGAAFLRGGAGQSFDVMLADPWGRTVIVDINAAFAGLIAVVWLVEPRRPIALAITVLTPVIGSFIPLIWLIVRAKRLAALARMSPSTSAGTDR